MDTTKVAPKGDLMNVNTVKGSQFRQPLIEFQVLVLMWRNSIHKSYNSVIWR